jgi:hypothetical protein
MRRVAILARRLGRDHNSAENFGAAFESHQCCAAGQTIQIRSFRDHQTDPEKLLKVTALGARVVFSKHRPRT